VDLPSGGSSGYVISCLKIATGQCPYIPTLKPSFVILRHFVKIFVNDGGRSPGEPRSELPRIAKGNIEGDWHADGKEIMPPKQRGGLFAEGDTR
jgi:hypothetical protein